MAETLREPAVALSPDSGIFSRNMRAANRRTGEAGLSMLESATGTVSDETGRGRLSVFFRDTVIHALFPRIVPECGQ